MAPCFPNVSYPSPPGKALAEGEHAAPSAQVLQAPAAPRTSNYGEEYSNYDYSNYQENPYPVQQEATAADRSVLLVPYRYHVTMVIVLSSFLIPMSNEQATIVSSFHSVNKQTNIFTTAYSDHMLSSISCTCYVKKKLSMPFLKS